MTKWVLAKGLWSITFISGKGEKIIWTSLKLIHQKWTGCHEISWWFLSRRLFLLISSLLPFSYTIPYNAYLAYKSLEFCMPNFVCTSFLSLIMHSCTSACDILFVLCTQNDVYAACRQKDPIFCMWLAYKCLHTNHFAVQFLLPSYTISTTVPAIPTTTADTQNPIRCGHYTGTCSMSAFIYGDQIVKAQS